MTHLAAAIIFSALLLGACAAVADVVRRHWPLIVAAFRGEL